MRVALLPHCSGDVPFVLVGGEQLVDPAERMACLYRRRATGSARCVDLSSRNAREVGTAIQAQSPSRLVDARQQLVVQRHENLCHGP